MYRGVRVSQALVAALFATSGLTTLCGVAIEVRRTTGPRFVSGLRHPEDIVRLERTPWVIASQMTIASGTPLRSTGYAALVALNSASGLLQELRPSSTAADWDRTTFPDCPSPAEQLSPHGLSVRLLSADRYRLYVVNHAGRESIEVIDLHVGDEGLETIWRGCIWVPGTGATTGIWPNAVASFADGRLAVSGGGGVAIWKPGAGWTTVKSLAGRGMRLFNGIERSSANDRLFVVASDDEGPAVFVAPMDGMGEVRRLAFGFKPDNLRYGDDGLLYVAGPAIPRGADETTAYRRCVDAGTVCVTGFGVGVIDPKTLAHREIFKSENGLEHQFGLATTALKIGDHLWLSTARGDRLAMIPYRP